MLLERSYFSEGMNSLSADASYFTHQLISTFLQQLICYAQEDYLCTYIHLTNCMLLRKVPEAKESFAKLKQSFNTEPN